jgi:hypothetical protein
MNIMWGISSLFPIKTPSAVRLSQFTLENNARHLESALFTKSLLQEIGSSIYDHSIPEYHSWPDRYAHLVSDLVVETPTSLAYMNGSVVQQSGQIHESAFHTAIRNRSAEPPKRTTRLSANTE